MLRKVLKGGMIVNNKLKRAGAIFSRLRQKQALESADTYDVTSYTPTNWDDEDQNVATWLNKDEYNKPKNMHQMPSYDILQANKGYLNFTKKAVHPKYIAVQFLKTIGQEPTAITPTHVKNYLQYYKAAPELTDTVWEWVQKLLPSKPAIAKQSFTEKEAIKEIVEMVQKAIQKGNKKEVPPSITNLLPLITEEAASRGFTNFNAQGILQKYRELMGVASNNQRVNKVAEERVGDKPLARNDVPGGEYKIIVTKTTEEEKQNIERKLEKIPVPVSGIRQRTFVQVLNNKKDVVAESSFSSQAEAWKQYNVLDYLTAPKDIRLEKGFTRVDSEKTISGPESNQPPIQSKRASVFNWVERISLPLGYVAIEDPEKTDHFIMVNPEGNQVFAGSISSLPEAPEEAAKYIWKNFTALSKHVDLMDTVLEAAEKYYGEESQEFNELELSLTDLSAEDIYNLLEQIGITRHFQYSGDILRKYKPLSKQQLDLFTEMLFGQVKEIPLSEVKDWSKVRPLNEVLEQSKKERQQITKEVQDLFEQTALPSADEVINYYEKVQQMEEGPEKQKALNWLKELSKKIKKSNNSLKYQKDVFKILKAFKA